MKQSKTVLKELTAAYRAVLRHGILCNAIALGLVAMPAVADDPATTIPKLGYLDDYVAEVLSQTESVLNTQNEKGFDIGSITIGTDVDSLVNDHSLRYGVSDRASATQYVKMEQVGLPTGVGQIALTMPKQSGESPYGLTESYINLMKFLLNDQIEETETSFNPAIADGKSLLDSAIQDNMLGGRTWFLNAADHAMEYGKIEDGALYTSDEMIVDGNYGEMAKKLISTYLDSFASENIDIKETAGAVVGQLAQKLGNIDNVDKIFKGAFGISLEELNKLESDEINQIFAGYKDNLYSTLAGLKDLKLNVGSVAMNDGNVTFKNNVTLNVADVAITGGNVNLASDADVNINLQDVEMSYAGQYTLGEDEIRPNSSESYTKGGVAISGENTSLTIANGAKLTISGAGVNVTDGATIENSGVLSADIVLADDGTYTSNNGTLNGNLTINAKGNANFYGDTIQFTNMENGGNLNIATTTATINGLTGTGALTVAKGTTLNIGTSSIAQNTITLNGDMLATLREGDAQITAETFDGTGTLKLTMAQAGTYKVFGDDTFDNIVWDESGLTTSSPIYNLVWNGGDVTATRKTAAEVAEDNNLTNESASFVSNLTDSSSDKLTELSVKLQEKLANGDTESVEHATQAVHPETESVVQSVSTSVQNTVVNLAASRMVMPTVGRAGGDVNLTSGGMWVQGLYNKSKQADAFNGYTRGIAAGLDGTINKVLTIGAGYSFAHSDIDGTARNTEIDSNTLFLYGQYKPSNWYLNAVANYTWSDYSENGTVIDNTPIFADYNVNSFGGNIATGYDFDNGITPELGLRYIHISADDYTNSFGVKTHMDDADYMTGILGARYTFNVVANKYTTFMPQLHAAAKYDLLSDKNVATVTMPGIDSYTMDGERLNRFGGEFGIGLGVKYRNLDMSLNYDIDVRKDYTSQTGMLKFRANF